MINVDYRRLDECRLIHQHPQTYYHQSRESLGKPAPVSKLAFFLFFNFFSSRKTQKPEKGCGDPRGKQGTTHISPGLAELSPVGLRQSPGAGGDADVTCSVERSIWQNGEPAGEGRLGDGQKQNELKKKKSAFAPGIALWVWGAQRAEAWPRSHHVAAAPSWVRAHGLFLQLLAYFLFQIVTRCVLNED